MRLSRTIAVFGGALLAAALAVPAPATTSHDWPQLRGPANSGRAAGSGVFGDTVGLRLDWKQDLGSGYSGIAVVGDRVLTMFTDGEFDYLVALNAAGGKELWRYTIDPYYAGHDGSADGPISSPTVADGVVYGLGPKGKLFALGLADGRELWSRRIEKEFGAEAPTYGFTSSPVVAGTTVALMASYGDGHSIYGFDRTTGEPRWKLGEDKVAYQNPAVMQVDGKPILLAASNHLVSGIDPASGTELWRYQHSEKAGEGHAMPVVVGDNRFLLNSWQEAAMFSVKESDATWKIEELWRNNAFKSTWAIPVYHDGYVYGFSSRFLTCVDPASGEVKWKSREPGGTGLIVVDGHLVVFAKDGFVAVAEASPGGYVEKARLTVTETGGLTWPAFANGHIFLRTLTDIASVAVTGTPTRAARARIDPAIAASAFHAFVKKVESAPPSERLSLVDQFMKSQERVPIVEGSDLVHFVFRSDARDVAVETSMHDQGDADAMLRIEGTDLCYRSYKVAPGSRLEYRFNVDFDDHVPDPLNPRRAETAAAFSPEPPVYSELTLPGWSEPLHIREPEGVRRSRLEESEFESQVLKNKRSLQVYLPPGYDAGKERYPLLLVNDGGDWIKHGKLTNTLDNLIAQKRISPLIVAFVGRIQGPFWKELGGSQMADYARMLATELVPHLDKKFRTQARPESRAVMGTGGAGLSSIYAALAHPQVFQKVAVQSLYLSPEGEVVLSLLDKRKSDGLRFYLDWSLYEERSPEQGWDLGEDSRRFAAALEKHGFDYVGGEATDSAGWGSWRARSDRILTAFFPAGGSRKAGL